MADKPPAKQQDVLVNFINEGQNPLIVRDLYAKLQPMLTTDEHIVNIFIQHKLIGLNSSAIVTNWRLFLHHPHIIGGATIESHLWRLLGHPIVKEGPIYGEFSIETRFEPIKMMKLLFLPKLQALRLFSLAKEQADWWDEEHRLRNLELQRAASGGLVLKGGLSGMAEQPHPVVPLPHAPFPFHPPAAPGISTTGIPPAAGPALRAIKVEEPEEPKSIQEAAPSPTLEPTQLSPEEPPSSATASSTDPLERLRQLKLMLDQGLISKEDYAEKRQQILDQI